MEDVNDCQIRAIEEALEQVNILIALRTASESSPPSRFALI